jgi:phospholipid/cholesterol/gamma-HCH transport system ATP-binding protein
VENVIELKKISKSFNGRPVLSNFDLSVWRGETYVLIGRSGMGKSTVLKHMAGLETPERGMVNVFGQDVGKLDPKALNDLRKKIGYVFQYAALFDSMTVFENVAFRLLRDFRLPESKALKIVHEKLALVGLESEIAERMPSELSGGMRKRVGLARAIAVDPELILYDEPTSGLDPVTAQSINLLILDMQRKLKVTSVVVTHDMQSAYQVADRIGMIYDGRIIHEGTASETRGSKNPYVQQFVTGSVEGPMTAR